jgi:hypothetical protein
MTNRWNKLIAVFSFGLMITMEPALEGISLAQTPPTKDSKTSKTTGAKPSEVASAPSEKEIADAKAKGEVWVNLSSKIYHKEGKFYGKTKRGKFMSEDEAKKAGYREAKTETAPKAKTGDAKQK